LGSPPRGGRVEVVASLDGVGRGKGGVKRKKKEPLNAVKDKKKID